MSYLFRIMLLVIYMYGFTSVGESYLQFPRYQFLVTVWFLIGEVSSSS